MAKNILKPSTVKDTPSSVIRSRIHFSITRVRATLFNLAAMLILYFMFNFFTLLILEFQLEHQLDSKLKHEMEHFIKAFTIESDSLIMLYPKEFEESDLVMLTENPFFLKIVDSKQNLLMSSRNFSLFGKIPFSGFGANQKIEFENFSAEEIDLRVGHLALFDGQKEIIGFMFLATPKSTANQITSQIILFNVITFPFFLLIMLLISAFMAKKTFAPVNKIINLAQNISTENLGLRVEYEADPKDEMGRLRDTLNLLFDRLENQVQQIVQFSNNASHQLLTPLTVMRSETDFLLKTHGQNREIAEGLEEIDEQLNDMIHIVNVLLLLAKNCNICKDDRQVIQMKNIISRLEKEFLNVNVVYDNPDKIFIRGNPDYLYLAIENLISNAIKYSEPESQVICKVAAEDKHVVIRVEDKGIGINETDLDRIFEPFYRGEDPVVLNIHGFGLGLSLVKSIIDAMGGHVKITNNDPKGTIFIIELEKLNIG